MADTDQLWGGQLIAMGYDTTRRVLELTIAVDGDGSGEWWSLRATDVADLRVDRPDEGWESTEVTEVHVRRSGARGQMEIVFWVEPSGLSATFSELSVSRQS